MLHDLQVLSPLACLYDKKYESVGYQAIDICDIRLSVLQEIKSYECQALEGARSFLVLF